MGATAKRQLGFPCTLDVQSKARVGLVPFEMRFLLRRSELRGCGVHLEAATVHRVHAPCLAIGCSTATAGGKN